MNKKMLLTSISAGLINLSLVTSADATLLSRLDGQAYYDDVLDVTWLADANYALTSGYDADGRMTWEQSTTWVNSLNIEGVTEWRLPTMIDTGASGCDHSFTGGTDCGYNMQTGSAATTVYSELASLWTDTLGNTPFYDTDGNSDQLGWGFNNTGPFNNVLAKDYWFSTEYAPNTDNAWTFRSNKGGQDRVNKGSLKQAWAVHSGDVSAVPVPTAVWLFASGIIGLLGFAKRKV